MQAAPSGDVAQFFRDFGNAILNRIHPAPGSLNTLLDPFNQNTDYNYSMQLQIIQGICFGLAISFLLGGIIFAMGRFLYDGFGGREPSKFGYSSAAVWTNKLAYYFFGTLTLISIIFGIVSLSKMYTGIGSAVDIYYATLPPLSNIQRQYMQRIIEKNDPMFLMVQNGNLTDEFRVIWNSGVNTTLTTTATKVNFSEPTTQIASILNQTQTGIADMRANRINVASILSTSVNEIAAQVAGTSLQNDVNNILQQFQQFYNLTEMDNVMRGFNISASSLTGTNHGDATLAFIGNALNQELESSNYIKAVHTALNSTDVYMQRLYKSLGAGVARCKSSLASGFTVPFGGAGMTKFTALVEMLSPIRNIMIPILLVAAGVLILSLFVGGAAFPKRWHQTMYTIAFLFLFGIITMWTLNGFLVPAAIVTSDTCSDPTLFRNDTNLVFSSSSLASLYVPTCAACDGNNVFKNWSDFSNAATKMFNEKFQVNQSLSAPVFVQPDNQQVSGASVILQTLKNIESSLKAANVPAPTANLPWKSNIKSLRRTSAASNEPFKSIIDNIETLGNELSANITLLYNGYTAFKNNMSSTLKPMNSISQTMEDQLKEMQKTFSAVFKSMQSKIDELQKMYQSVPIDPETQCRSDSSSSLNNAYSRFETSLCGDGSAGLNGTWITNFFTAILLIPLVVIAVKAFKHLAFANFFQDDYQAF